MWTYSVPLPFCRRLARLPHAVVLRAIWERGPGIAGAISGCPLLIMASVPSNPCQPLLDVSTAVQFLQGALCIRVSINGDSDETGCAQGNTVRRFISVAGR